MSTTPSVGEGVIQAGVMARARVPVTEVGSSESTASGSLIVMLITAVVEPPVLLAYTV